MSLGFSEEGNLLNSSLARSPGECHSNRHLQNMAATMLPHANSRTPRVNGILLRPGHSAGPPLCNRPLGRGQHRVQWGSPMHSCHLLRRPAHGASVPGRLDSCSRPAQRPGDAGLHQRYYRTAEGGSRAREVPAQGSTLKRTVVPVEFQPKVV